MNGPRAGPANGPPIGAGEHRGEIEPRGAAQLEKKEGETDD